LEKNRTDTATENVRRDVEIAELKAGVMKLRDNNEENKQQTQDTSLEEVVNAPSSVLNQSYNASPSLCEEDRKTDEFLDSVLKKGAGDEIRNNPSITQKKW
jgi:hypothetical protein